MCSDDDDDVNDDDVNDDIKKKRMLLRTLSTNSTRLPRKLNVTTTRGGVNHAMMLSSVRALSGSSASSSSSFTSSFTLRQKNSAFLRSPPRRRRRRGDDDDDDDGVISFFVGMALERDDGSNDVASRTPIVNRCKTIARGGIPTSVSPLDHHRRARASRKKRTAVRVFASATNATDDDGPAAADNNNNGGGEEKNSNAAAAKDKKTNYPKLHVQTSGRIVAIGDLHGDIQQARRALRIAGVLGKDDNDHVNPRWVGGDTILVQVGDVLDRGDDEIGILILLQKLGKEARKVGGDVFVLNGNHEILNISGDFRYVSRGAFHESMRFSDHLVKLFGKDAVPGRRRRRRSSSTEEDGEEEEEEEMDEWRKQTTARVGLFSPGGPLAQQLSMHHTVLIVNDTVFAHGGLVPRHVDFGLDKLNRSVSEWMRGKRIEDEETKVALGMAIGGVKDSVVWHRAYGTEHYPTNTERTTACTLLSRTLDKINEVEGIPVKRLVVGHTPQMQGANCECDGKIWRVDVGMSFGVLGANPQVLEIIGDEVNILTREVPVTMSKL